MAMSDEAGQQIPEPAASAQPGDELFPLELDMLRVAAAGGLLDLREGPFDLAVMNGWGPHRTIRAAVLRHLLVAGEWPMHAKGVQLRGVRVSGSLDLEAAILRCPLRLEDCYLDDPGPVVLDYATVSLLTLTGCFLAGLTGDRLVVTRGIDLTGSTFTGPLLLRGADITGQLSCRRAQLTSTDSEGNVLAAQGIRVGTVFLDQGFSAAGAIRLWDADIAGSLVCDGAQLTGADNGGYALLGDRVKVGGGVSLHSGFSAAGAIRLWDADIAGSLNCSGAQLTGVDGNGNALFGDGMKVGADVLLDGGFSATGTVSLKSACVEGSLGLKPVKLAEGKGKTALDATGAQIAHTLRWAPMEQITGRVTLEDAVVGQLADDWTQAGGRANGYWPPDGLLRLDGFTYTRIGGEQQATGKQRLAWIQSQYKPATKDSTAVFATQPYEQLAKVYRQAGQDREARNIAIACRRDMRRYGNLTSYRKAANWLLDVTIRYGYQTGRAVTGVAFLYLVVLAFFWSARYHNAMIPVQATAGMRPPPTATHCTGSYPCFNPFGYAIDTVIPLIDVHQADFWGPNASAPWGQACVIVTYLATGLGWLFATLAVAGYTGLVRNNNSL